MSVSLPRSPVYLLELLQKGQRGGLLLDPDPIPASWRDPGVIDALIAKLDCRDSCTPVVSADRNNYPWMRYPRSSVGLEAAYMLLSIQGGLRYPSTLYSGSIAGRTRGGVLLPGRSIVRKLRRWHRRAD